MADRQLRVIVVDDSGIFQRIVMESIAGIPSAQVVGAANCAKTAIDVIDAHKPDIAVVDWEMPNGGGPEVLEHVRRNGLSVGVIVLSGCENRAVRAKAMELGAFDYVEKPKEMDREKNSKFLRRSLAAKFAALTSYLDMVEEPDASAKA